MIQKTNINERLAHLRKNANQGEFFFAKAVMSNGEVIPRPVFILGKNNDSNDDKDVIVCSCTKEPARTRYDKEVQLKYKTMVRTNKIYTISREQLEFKIQSNLSPAEISEIILIANKSIALFPTN